MNTPKLCKDCRYIRQGLFVQLIGGFFLGDRWKHALCGHPSKASPVSGSVKDDEFCEVERNFDHTPCGREGKLWEAKS